MALARFAALRRRRVPASLAGLGPGRPQLRAASSAVLAGHDGATYADNDADAPRRQKMPLGSPRRDVAAPKGEPSFFSQRYEPRLRPSPTAPRAPPTAVDSTPTPASPAQPPIRTAQIQTQTPSSSPPPSHPPTIPRWAADPAPTHTSIVHAHLAHGSPRTPRELVAYLAERRHLITQEAVAALDAFAARENDYQARLDARALLARERLPPLPDALRRKAGLNTPKPLDGEANIALRYRYPPVALQGYAVEVTPAAFLCDIHFRLLAKTQTPYGDAVEALRSLRSPVTDQVALLDLYLGYSDDPVPLLDAFDAAFPSTPTSRETRHRALLSLLRTKPTHDALAALVQRFSAGGKLPGAETWRHIGRYALDADDAAVAEWAFRGALDEFARVRLERLRQDTKPLPAMPALLDTPKYAVPTTLQDVQPRFAHSGRHVTRFEWLMQAYRDKGWVERGEPLPVEADQPDSEHFSPLPRPLARWTWVGRAGEDGAEARRDARWAELAATRDLQLAIAEAIARGTFTDISELSVTRVLTDDDGRPLHDPRTGALEFKRQLKLIKAAAAHSRPWALDVRAGAARDADTKRPTSAIAKKRRWKAAKAGTAARDLPPHMGELDTEADADAGAEEED
ncbi:uncharacterized protein LOC62_01G000805 [Vanrija pseudolonga]|uniref:Uncharacterized protein n=1 Tax=Vanrija pseudolonga TaxID=143232 RepID=A0AAF1BEX5_9TREE|nr:hypothetical protein LOC62_01G000805 [Vanrija pseudolonga]